MTTDTLFALLRWLEYETLGKLVLALVLGTAIGLEREVRGKAAGLRTIILITVGSALFTEASLTAATLRLHELVRADPGRIAAQIVTGVGFIGAGTILVHRGSVHGLTTAASLWVAAAIGVTAGLGQYVAATGGTILVLLTLTVVRWMEGRLLPHRTTMTLRLVAESMENLDWLEAEFDAVDLEATPVELSKGPDHLSATFEITGPRKSGEAVVTRLFGDGRIRAVEVR